MSQINYDSRGLDTDRVIAHVSSACGRTHNEKELRRALLVLRRANGDHSAQTASVSFRLGMCLIEVGHEKEGCDMFTEALATTEHFDPGVMCEVGLVIGQKASRDSIDRFIVNLERANDQTIVDLSKAHVASALACRKPQEADKLISKIKYHPTLVRDYAFTAQVVNACVPTRNEAQLRRLLDSLRRVSGDTSIPTAYTLYGLGMVLLERGREKEGLEVLTQALATKEHLVFLEGAAFAVGGKCSPTAVSKFLTYLERFDQVTVDLARSCVASQLAGRNRQQEANELVSHIRYHPNSCRNLKVIAQVANTCWSTGNETELQRILAAVRSERDSAITVVVLSRLGNVLYAAGKTAELKTISSQICSESSSKSDLVAYAHAMDILLTSRDAKSALALFNSWKDRQSRDHLPSGTRLAQLCLDQNEPEDAISVCNSLLKLISVNQSEFKDVQRIKAKAEATLSIHRRKQQS